MTRAATKQDSDWLMGGGATGELIRSTDWSSSAIGPIASWPQSLRTALSMCLASHVPMYIYWGPDHIQFYNDAGIPIYGDKHPHAFGRPFIESFPELWNDIKPLFDAVMVAGQITLIEDRLLMYRRSERIQETYLTFSYTPISDEGGGVGGVYTAVFETTSHVMGLRRQATQRDLFARGFQASTVDEACAIVGEVLAGNPQDVPFALVYLAQADGSLHLAGQAGIAAGASAAPHRLQPGDGAAVWPVAAVLAGRQRQTVEDLPRRFADLPRHPWPEPADRAMVLPIEFGGAATATGVLVVGMSPHIPSNEEYLGFIDLLAGQVGAVIGNAKTLSEERQRAQALAEIDRAKTEFFSNVSHEFRTPLTLMLGPLEKMLASPGLAAAQRDPLSVVHRNGLRLLKLVNTLLDFSRIEAGRAQASFEATDLSALTAELAGVFRSAIEQAGLQLVIDCPPLPQPVFVDREMWEKIVLNLLSNALKFTFEGQVRVQLRWIGPPAGVELVVSDTGVGIPAAELPRIFERFHRVQGTRSRTHEGTGIGLALIQELARLHGGEVQATSREGAGTAFTVRIPAGAAHLPQDRIGVERSGTTTRIGASPFVEEVSRWLPDGGKAAQSATGAEPPGGRPRILLADDNADMRDYVSRILGERCQVEAVADGQAALEAARLRPPQLVLSDVMMPRMDGFELLRALRADPALRAIPIILLSARAGEESRIEGLHAGADDYLVKPFSARELLARVAMSLEMSRLRTEALASAEREAGAAALRASEQRFRAIVSHATTGVAQTDLAGRFTLVNDRYCEMLGYSRAELLEMRLQDVTHPEDLGGNLEQLERLLQGGQNFVIEKRYRRKDGSFLWVSNSVTAIRDDSGAAQSVVAVSLDITERKKAEADQKQREAELRAADRRKDEFLAMLGHELRNPLAPIANAIHLLRRDPAKDPVQLQARAIIERQTGRLARLVDDLLEVAHITSGRIQLQQERVAIAGIVERAVETVHPLIEQHRHTLAVDIAEEPIWVHADAARMEQVVVNLLNNAAKYTPDGGRIAVAVRREGSHAVVCVQDSGIGIDPALLPRVFELFTQAERSLDRAQGGLGIGLALVQRLVGMHGGTVSASSVLGQGSEFVVRLPALQAAAAPVSPGGSQAAGLAMQPLRVLVVDDNVDAAESLAILLQASGHDVRTAYDGHAALDAAREHRPQVAFLDIGLPKLDGYEVAKRLRGDGTLAPIQLVAMTGYGQSGDRERSRDCGFHTHLVKPVDFGVVVGILGEFVKS